MRTLLEMKLNDTFVVSVDGESDGFHGDCIAIGGHVLCVSDGSYRDSFQARYAIQSLNDAWANENILPMLEDMLVTHADAKSMRDSFWGWLYHWTRVVDRGIRVADDAPNNVLFVVDFGIPVEANLLHACVADDPENRSGKLPYPTHELGTLLLAAGYDPDVNREELAQRTGLIGEARKHDPRWDAKVSCHLAVHCLRLIQDLHRRPEQRVELDPKDVTQELLERILQHPTGEQASVLAAAPGFRHGSLGVLTADDIARKREALRGYDFLGVFGNRDLTAHVLTKREVDSTVEAMVRVPVPSWVADVLNTPEESISMGCTVKQTVCSLCGAVEQPCQHLKVGMPSGVVHADPDVRFLYTSSDSTPADPVGPNADNMSIELFGLGGGMKHEPPPADRSAIVDKDEPETHE